MLFRAFASFKLPCNEYKTEIYIQWRANNDLKSKQHFQTFQKIFISPLFPILHFFFGQQPNENIKTENQSHLKLYTQNNQTKIYNSASGKIMVNRIPTTNQSFKEFQPTSHFNSILCCHKKSRTTIIRSNCIRLLS